MKISLFSVWSHYSPNIPLSLVASTLFPLTYVCLYWRKATKNLLFSYSSILLIVSIIIYSVFSETGPREFHGNFGWGRAICNYILFAVTLLMMVEGNPEIRWRKMATKDRVIFFRISSACNIWYFLYRQNAYNRYLSLIVWPHRLPETTLHRIQ